MIAKIIKEQIESCAEYFQQSEDLEYYLISSLWLKQYYRQEIKDDGKQVIMNKELLVKQKNVLNYSKGELNIHVGQKMLQGKDFELCTHETWDMLKFYERIPILRKAKIIQGVKKIAIQFIRVRLVTLCEGIQNLIEGHQSIDPYWSLEEMIDIFEQALQSQLSYQVPRKGFIKLYHVGKNVTYKEFKENLHELVRPLENCLQIEEESIIVIDIKEIGKGYYFREIQEKIELTEYSKQGLANYDYPTCYLSKLLKCYECVGAIRDELDSYPKLKCLIEQAYYGSMNLVQYDDFEIMKEYRVKAKKQYIETFYIEKEPKQLGEDFRVQDQDQIQFSSSLHHLDEKFKHGYTHQVRKLKNIEKRGECVKGRIFVCTKNNDEFFNYDCFAAMQLCLLPKDITGNELYALINEILYEQDEQPKDLIIELRSTQVYQKKCQYCQRDICNNCEVEKNDKKLNITSDVVLYAVHKQAIVNFPQIQIQEFNASIDKCFDFINCEDKYLILQLDEEIPFKLQCGNYQLKGIITKENCICLISNRWIDKNNFEVRNHQNKWVEFPELKIIEDPTKFKAEVLFYEIGK